MILAVVDAATCLLAGFAIFSILGYLALSQGKDVEEVVKEGQTVVVVASLHLQSMSMSGLYKSLLRSARVS